MAEAQKATHYRLLVLRGNDADRRLAQDIEAGEFHITTDQLRIWIGKHFLLSGSPHHTAADQAARLNLKNTAQRGCYPGDTCKQTDTGKVYLCVSNEGTIAADWLDLTDHQHTLSQITDAGTAAGYNVAVTGDAAVGEVVKGDDSRLTNSRPPTYHFHDDLYYRESEVDGFLAGKANLTHTHLVSDLTDAGTSVTYDVPASGDASAIQVVKGNDSRLSDPRTPTAHTHPVSDLTDAGTSVTYDVAASGDASAIQVVKGNDSRLSDPRTPTAHTHTVSDLTDAGTSVTYDVAASGDASASQVVKGNDSRLSDPRPPTAHTHTVSDLTDAGTAATRDVAASGDASVSQVVTGNDTRLSDPRTPTAHTHAMADVTDAGTAATRNVPVSGDAAATEVVLGNDSRLGTSVGVIPIGGIFAYDTGITGASYPTGVFARCEGGSYPDLRDKFIMGATTSGGTGGSTTHSHTASVTTVNASPCSGSGVAAVVAVSISEENHLPPYRKEIMLCRYA